MVIYRSSCEAEHGFKLPQLHLNDCDSKMSSPRSSKDLDRAGSPDGRVADRKDPKGVTATPTVPELAAQEGQRMEGALGDAILRFLRIRKRPKNDGYDLDAVCHPYPKTK